MFCFTMYHHGEIFMFSLMILRQSYLIIVKIRKNGRSLQFLLISKFLTKFLTSIFEFWIDNFFLLLTFLTAFLYSRLDLLLCLWWWILHFTRTSSYFAKWLFRFSFLELQLNLFLKNFHLDSSSLHSDMSWFIRVLKSKLIYPATSFLFNEYVAF